MMNGREVIPSHWNYRKISEVTTKVGSGSTPRGGESVYQDLGVPLIRSMNVHSSGFKSDGLALIDADEAKKLDHVIVQPSDVLLNITGASIGRVTTAPTALAGARVNQHVCIIRPRAELSSSFLSYFLASPREQTRVMNVQVGATRQALTKAMILDWDVPVPPFHEQQEIVAEIEKQFSRLDEAVASLKRYKAAVLKAAVEGKLTEEWRKAHPDVEPASKLLEGILAERRAKWNGRGKYKEPSAPEISALSSLPKNWVWATVEQLSRLVQYGSSAKTHEEAIGVPVLRMGNIEDGRLRFDSLKYLPKKHDEFPDRFLREGDILFNRTNSAELVGKTAVYKGKPSPCAFASYLIRVRLTEGYAPDLLAYFINSVFGRTWIGQVVSQQVGQANVNGTKLQALAVPLPPYDEQVQIVAEVEHRLSVIDELEATVEANLARADRLRQSILSQAFSGRLNS